MAPLAQRSALLVLLVAGVGGPAAAGRPALPIDRLAPPTDRAAPTAANDDLTRAVIVGLSGGGALLGAWLVISWRRRAVVAPPRAPRPRRVTLAVAALWPPRPAQRLRWMWAGRGSPLVLAALAALAPHLPEAPYTRLWQREPMAHLWTDATLPGSLDECLLAGGGVEPEIQFARRELAIPATEHAPFRLCRRAGWPVELSEAGVVHCALRFSRATPVEDADEAQCGHGAP